MLGSYKKVFLTDRTPIVVANSTTKFDSVSYTAVPDETPEGPVPEYEEIADADLDQSESSNEKDTCSAAKIQLHYYSVGPQSSKDNHDCTVVSLFSIDYLDTV